MLFERARYLQALQFDVALYFLSPDHPHVLAVWPYVQDVLDAVGIRNGCGHAEIMLTAHGPRLIEIAERPAGGGHQRVSMLATGDNHIERTIAHVTGEPFRLGYVVHRRVRGIFLSAPTAGIWRNGDLFDGIESLPTYYDLHLPHTSGDLVPKTVDLTNALGWVILAGADAAAIEADYCHMKKRETLIDIEPPVLADG